MNKPYHNGRRYFELERLQVWTALVEPFSFPACIIFLSSNAKWF
ncbi:MAG: hypothetical protein U9Q91_06485 [Candidatus Marinimicrobia bacterium]|nr:hypothetical protein [Candidatus Neomarinimicrobiota bacterium]